MCPACIGAAALIAGSATTTGGVAAFVVKKLSEKLFTNKIRVQVRVKENHHGH
jgi:hypothetical protein